MDEAIGERYHRTTRYDRSSSFTNRVPIRPPEPFKSYPDAVSIPLPMSQDGPVTLDEALHARKSIREFSPRSIEIHDLAYLLWASTGIQRTEMGMAFRTAPSAGALYPIETYVAVNRGQAINAGIYHYDIRGHALACVREGEFGADIAWAALGQDMCAQAAAVFIWTAVFNRSRWKYRERAYRYIYMEAGHIAENLALAGVSRKLGSCHIAAFFDAEIEAIVAVDGVQEGVLYMTALGYPS